MRRRIAFSTSRRSPATRAIIQSSLRLLKRHDVYIVQISAQRIHEIPPLKWNDESFLIVPNVTTVGQAFDLKRKGFAICDVRTSEKGYTVFNNWIDKHITMDKIRHAPGIPYLPRTRNYIFSLQIARDMLLIDNFKYWPRREIDLPDLDPIIRQYDLV